MVLWALPSPTVKVKVSTPVTSDTWSTWKDRRMSAAALVGHEDLCTACDVDAVSDVAVTASRDTTVLVWRVSSPDSGPLASLRGHTMAVTCVKLLPRTFSDGKVCAVSGSLDCSLKVWDVWKGVQLRSIYTYNGIKCLGVLGERHVVTGTDGGKLEVFNLANGTNVHSSKCHDDSITALNVSGSQIATGCRDGIIKVFDISIGSSS